MKDEIKSILEAKGGKIKHESRVNKILWTLKGRFDKHGKIYLSRKEFSKFGMSEKQLRNIIDAFRGTGFLEYIGQEKKPGNKFKSNIYRISNELKDIFNMMVGGIKDMYLKVGKFVENNGIEVLKRFGIKLFNEKRKLIEKKVSISRKGQIKNWKTGKGYNIFSYLMEYKGLNCFQLAKELKL